TGIPTGMPRRMAPRWRPPPAASGWCAAAAMPAPPTACAAPRATSWRRTAGWTTWAFAWCAGARQQARGAVFCYPPAPMGHVLAIGIATLDIVNTVDGYPAEDAEVRASAQRVSRGGNATN